ncbi:hypothetical protein D3C81_1706480 [compost metagenome]
MPERLHCRAHEGRVRRDRDIQRLAPVSGRCHIHHRHINVVAHAAQYEMVFTVDDGQLQMVAFADVSYRSCARTLDGQHAGIARCDLVHQQSALRYQQAQLLDVPRTGATICSQFTDAVTDEEFRLRQAFLQGRPRCNRSAAYQ